MPPRRPPVPKPNPAPIGGVAKPSEGPHVTRVGASIQRKRKRQNGVLSDEDIVWLKKLLRRARYADEHGGYVAGDAAIAAEEALAAIAAEECTCPRNCLHVRTLSSKSSSSTMDGT